jgi:hypothetical protein
MTIETAELYGYHSEIHKPTGVEESVVLNFYNDEEQNLLVTSVNILSVYRIIPDSRIVKTYFRSFFVSKIVQHSF